MEKNINEKNRIGFYLDKEAQEILAISSSEANLSKSAYIAWVLKNYYIHKQKKSKELETEIENLRSKLQELEKRYTTVVYNENKQKEIVDKIMAENNDQINRFIENLLRKFIEKDDMQEIRSMAHRQSLILGGVLSGDDLFNQAYEKYKKISGKH